MRLLLALLLALLCSAAQAQPFGPYGPAPSSMLPNSSNAQLPDAVRNLGVFTAPCDLLHSGCLSGWSVVELVNHSYTGPLFQVYRDDAATFRIGATRQGVVDLQALHADCDNHDCFFEYVYDQVGSNDFSNTTAGRMPLMQWAANGLPMLVADGHANDGTGQYLLNSSPTGLPTTGSRTTYVAYDNFEMNFAGLGTFGWGQPNSNPVVAGDTWAPVFMQASSNDPSNVFGNSLDLSNYAYGAFPSGYQQLAGVSKYNAATNELSSAVLPTNCPSPCATYTTYSGTPPGGLTINTGNGFANTLQLGIGTDNGTYGTHFQTGIIAAYASSATEDADVLAQLAATHFRVKASPCAVNDPTTAITAGTPGAASSTVPNTYVGVPPLNTVSLVGIWASSLVNPNWNGPLFRVKRADNGVTTDIYPLGCDADAAAITNAGSGTTLTVDRVFDQSGHGWLMQQGTVANQPPLSASGINGKACFSFTAASGGTSNPFLITSKDIWNHPGGSPTVAGLAKNMTLEVVWQTTASLNSYGSILSLPSNGLFIGNQSTTLKLLYGYPGNDTLPFGSTFTSGQAHFGYVTADASSTQNLSMNVDNGTVATGTTTGQASLGAGTYYEMGGTSATGGLSAAFKGCVAMAAVYNDIEPSANLLNAYHMAHNKWATP